jgi:enoyl-CoA hydratase/carnithine racemase
MNYKDYPTIRVDVVGGVATVTLSNPPINLFDINLYSDLARVSTELAADDEVRVVVLRSANPDFFIAHFDVTAILALPTDQSEQPVVNDFHAMCERFRTMPKATIAVIEGRVAGGGSELTLSCDMRFATLGRAIFNQPEVALGIIPGGTGTQRLSRLLGRSRALEAILGCDDVDAALAERWGWVNRALPDGELWPFVERLTRRLASFPPHAVAAAKASVLLAEKGLEADLAAEAALFNGTLKEPSARAAMERFLAFGGQTLDGELRLGSLIDQLVTT